MAGAMFTFEDITNSIYQSDLDNTRGDQIFANPNQITQALNALGENYQYSEGPSPYAYFKEWQGVNHEVAIMRSNTGIYSVMLRAKGGNPLTQATINAVKSVISGEAAPAGAARRRKNRKTKKVSRRRRTTRRR